MKVAPLFLRASREVGGLGLSLTEIGTLNGVFGSAAFVIGSLLGGIFVARYGLKKTLFMLCCVFNLPFLCLYFPCCSPADQSLSDRNMYHNGVFRLWFRICRTDLVHDAADCSWQTSDVTLCICFGNHESGSYASGNDQRLF